MRSILILIDFFRMNFILDYDLNRRGLVGMVNQGPNTNGSQFFFTLDSTPELDKKNTLFGKVVGKTVFNMLKLGEGEIIGETPVRTHKILKTEIISNPYDDMVARPRAKPQTTEQDEENDKKSKQTVSARAVKYIFVFKFSSMMLKSSLIRNYGLLSFGNEAEEDEEEISKISIVNRFCSSFSKLYRLVFCL